MTQLLDTFVTAFLAEQGRYVIEKFDDFDCYAVLDRDLDKITNTCTRAECERWIAKQSARKAFRAMRDQHMEMRHSGSMSIYWLLSGLAAEPETTSADAG